MDTKKPITQFLILDVHQEFQKLHCSLFYGR
jgi:hypothetical protein